MDYTIAAKETKYKGIWFRSRLEAKWAAFFDLTGVQYHYEPYDLPGWSPDFLVETGYSDDFLLEVKPVLKPDAALINKIQGACVAADVRCDAVIVGLAPWVYGEIGNPRIGWFVSSDGTTSACPLALLTHISVIDRDVWPLSARWEGLWGEAHNLSRFWKPQR